MNVILFERVHIFQIFDNQSFNVFEMIACLPDGNRPRQVRVNRARFPSQGGRILARGTILEVPPTHGLAQNLKCVPFQNFIATKAGFLKFLWTKFKICISVFFKLS
jgi:hypothetical protein